MTQVVSPNILLFPKNFETCLHLQYEKYTSISLHTQCWSILNILKLSSTLTSSHKETAANQSSMNLPTIQTQKRQTRQKGGGSQAKLCSKLPSKFLIGLFRYSLSNFDQAKVCVTQFDKGVQVKWCRNQWELLKTDETWSDILLTKICCPCLGDLLSPHQEGMKAPRRQPAPVAAAAVHPHPRRKAKSYIVLPHETEHIKYRCWTQQQSAMKHQSKVQTKDCWEHWQHLCSK